MRWPRAKALPGADQLIKHLHKLGIQLALASNSVRKNIDTKISYQQGVQDGLPIEPVFVKGLASDGGEYKGTTLLNLSLDKDSSASLPDQVRGMYFDWAKLEMNKIVKAVVSFGWDLSSGTTKRTIVRSKQIRVIE
ncbi:hypothetical protein QJS10_CPA01g01832 [Acorus calamus]|uniref:Uncharacterized protein n=1 Tax=Acorus calamus TaxID=4465 RepID=A0AAV9FN97_ACOCL|nr:hypothetical protein QJS10_CPA01g01832 [Acorus calamus]